MRAAHVLAIDLGTSGPKVAVCTLRGALVAGASAPVELTLLPGGGAEQDPERWWDAVVEAARVARASAGVPAAAIRAVAVTAQWSGTVPVDADGRTLAPAMIWMDSRGAGPVRRVAGGPVRVAGYDPRKLRKWVRLTGGAPSLSGKDPLGHILWFEANRPDLAREVDVYLEPKDWLNFRLTGRRAATRDSITLHWVTDNRDPYRIEYVPELLAMSGLDRSKLPDLVGATDILGPVRPEAAAALDLAPGTVVIGGTPDVQSATLGSGATALYEGHLYLGTSSWLTCHVPAKRTDVRSGIATLPAPVPGTYYVADEQEAAGACVEWLRDRVVWAPDGLSGPAPPDALARLDAVAATAPPGSGGVLFTPWLNGERTPVDDRTIRGGWHNQSLRTARPDLVRAVLEGVAQNSRWLLETVERFVGRRFPYLHLVGGGATSDLWCQIHADVLDRPVRRIADPVQANTRGVALLAGIALGVLTPEDLGRATPVVEVLEPRRAHRSTYDEQYRAFRALYRRTRSVHARLNP